MLIYDGGCGFCGRSVVWARRLGATCEFSPSYAVDLIPLGLTEADLDAAAWFVDPDGRLHRGHDAIARALRTSRHAPVRLLGRVVGSRVLRPVATRVYAWVSDNRHRLPGGAPSCTIDDVTPPQQAAPPA